jgi:hypothetical protein
MPAENSDWLTLPEIPPEFRRLGADRVPSYRDTYNAVINGIIPAQRGDNGRYRISRANLPIAAAALGVRLPPQSAPRATQPAKRARRAAAVAA